MLAPMFRGLLIVGGAALASGTVHAAETVPISNEPWARVVRDELSKSLFERTYGAEAEAARMQVPTRRLGGGLVTGRDSWSKDVMQATGVGPVPAYNYDPGVGVLYVEMQGVTLTPSCPTTDFANGALNCTPLVAFEVDVPPMPGGDSAQAAAFQQLRQYYDAFNVVMSTQRPPDYLPYTMAVIGGSAELVGQDPSCGIANVACDGLKRNHVSLTFPGCGDPAGVAAQETAHNWGLEHTDNNGDLMMQGVFAVQAFLDTCMNILNAPDSDTQCGYVHEIHCAAGDGEQQNSFAELMGVFGPRAPDEVDPEIVEIYPEDGSVFTPDDSFVVGARVEENGTMVGVKWTWLEGLPEELESFTQVHEQRVRRGLQPGAKLRGRRHHVGVRLVAAAARGHLRVPVRGARRLRELRHGDDHDPCDRGRRPAGHGRWLRRDGRHRGGTGVGTAGDEGDPDDDDGDEDDEDDGDDDGDTDTAGGSAGTAPRAAAATSPTPLPRSPSCSCCSGSGLVVPGVLRQVPRDVPRVGARQRRQVSERPGAEVGRLPLKVHDAAVIKPPARRGLQRRRAAHVLGTVGHAEAGDVGEQEDRNAAAAIRRRHVEVGDLHPAHEVVEIVARHPGRRAPQLPALIQRHGEPNAARRCNPVAQHDLRRHLVAQVVVLFEVSGPQLRERLRVLRLRVPDGDHFGPAEMRMNTISRSTRPISSDSLCASEFGRPSRIKSGQAVRIAPPTPAISHAGAGLLAIDSISQLTPAAASRGACPRIPAHA